MFVVSWENNTLNAAFQTGSLYGVEDSTGVCFTSTYTGEKNLKSKQTSGHSAAAISGSGSG